jgi:hypothetical protein
MGATSALKIIPRHVCDPQKKFLPILCRELRKMRSTLIGTNEKNRARAAAKKII